MAAAIFGTPQLKHNFSVSRDFVSSIKPLTVSATEGIFTPVLPPIQAGHNRAL
jgi:hypothetical protein